MIRALFVAAVVAAGIAPAGAQDRYETQKVVYHINYMGGEDAAVYRAAMNNIQNHINAVGAENLEVQVVLHGDGVELLREAVDHQQLQMAITNLKTQDVAFKVCENTLTGRDIDYEADLFEVWEDDIVPSGVAEISHLQQQGFTYIKP